MLQVRETKEYVNWFKSLGVKEKAQVQARIAKIRIEGHFGEVRQLSESLAELKWRNGRRVYFSTIQEDAEKVLVLLIGGNKNTQRKDIRKAKSMIDKLSGGLI